MNNSRKVNFGIPKLEVLHQNDGSIIIKNISEYLVKKCRSPKLKSSKPQIEEFTVFIKVKIDNLKEFSNCIPFKLNNELRTSKERTKISTDRKYLFISLISG